MAELGIKQTAGLKGTFVVGLLTFTLASLGAAVSGARWVLILFRRLQAAGAAILTPSSLVRHRPSGKVRQHVQVWTVSGSISGALGPAVGACSPRRPGTGSSCST